MISEELKKQAVSLGLCSEWTTGWGYPDKGDLCKKYVDGIDFCIEHDYPSVDYMIENFDGVMQSYGIFVDDVISKKNIPFAVLNGATKATIKLDGYAASRIYLRHDSELELVALDNSKTFVSVYDDAKLTVLATGSAKVYVYAYGSRCKINGNAIVKRKGAK